MKIYGDKTIIVIFINYKWYLIDKSLILFQFSYYYSINTKQ